MLGKIKEGQGLVEFALILPILLLMILGIIEAGWLIWAFISVQNVARETARYAITGQPLNDDGSPWTMTADERADAIFAYAQEQARASGLPIDDWPGKNQTLDEFEDPDNLSRARMFGILFRGQTSPEDINGTPYDPGLRGLNIYVQTYYNAALLDPLYNVIMGGRTIHLVGEVTLQNEGLNLALGGEPPPFAPNPGDTQGTGGSQGSTPKLTVLYQGSPAVTVPAGDLVNIQLTQHKLSKLYYVCLEEGGTRTRIVSSQNPVLSSGGSALITNYPIPLTTTSGNHTFSSHLQDPTCNPSTKEAEMTVNITVPTGPIITVAKDSSSGHADYAWPDNSLVYVSLFAHDRDTEYTINFDGSPMPVGDGTANTCKITTDSTRSGAKYCAVPDGLSEGAYLVTSGFATNTVQVSNAALTVQGSNIRFDNSTIRVNVRKHAPNHNYWMYLGSGSQKSFTTNSQGSAVIDMYIPDTFTGTLKVHTFDSTSYGTPDTTTREIADTSINVRTTTQPFIDLVGGPQRSAGDVVEMSLRNHAPNTNYDVWLAQDTGSGSAIGNIQTITTDGAGDSTRFPYKIPDDATSGNRMFISYLAGQSSVYSATESIEVLKTARLVIKGGEKHFPQEEITIYVRDHTPDTAFDIYIDLNGDGFLSMDEKVAENVVTDGNGDAEVTYTLPKSADLGDLSIPRTVASKQWDDDNNDEGDLVVASTDLIIIEADLTVTDIVFPNDPQPGTDMPVKLYIKNTTNITLTNFAFDNDLYFDPPSPPTTTQVLPPGDDKIWIDQIGAQQTLIITPYINVYNEGTFDVYGRTDTSNKVTEGDETNNILPTQLVISCNLTPVQDNFDDGSINPWTLSYFGNGGGAGPAPGWLSFYWQPSQPSQAMVLPAAAHVTAAEASLAQPPALPVPRSTPPPVVDTGQDASAVPVQPAVVQVRAAAIPNLQSSTFDTRISSDSDDIEEKRSNGNLQDGNTLGLVKSNGDVYVGLRFQNVTVPPGATIVNAYLEFRSAANDSSSTDLIIHGQDADNPGTFSGNSDVSNRLNSSATSATVNWNNVSAWSFLGAYQSPDISSIVQEIVDRGGWNSGNAMALLIDGSGQRTAVAHNVASFWAPLLHIEYSATPTPTPTATTSASTLCLDQTFSSSATEVLMEAEHFTGSQSGSIVANWEEGSYSGETIMQVPNGGSPDNTFLETTGPALLYEIDFQQAGTYYVYVRGRGPSGTDDSIHVGLDGVAVSNSSGVGFTYFASNSLSWENESNGHWQTRVEVTTPGVHTFYMWMRERGTQIDKIWLTQNSNPDTNNPPAENSCAPSGPTPTPTGTPTQTPTPTSTPTPVGSGSFSPPSDLVATLDANQVDVINLTWADNSGNEGTGPEEDGFIIERSLEGGPWEQVTTVGTDTTSYADASVSCGNKNYNYRVRGFISPDVFSQPSNTDNDTTGQCPADSCSGSEELDGNLILCSAGSSVTEASDADGGYGYIYRSVDSFTFDMVVRVMAVPTQTNQAVAGLEVRANSSDTANKVQLVIRNLNKQVRVFSRGSQSPTSSWISTGGTADDTGQIPTWLRIVRANGYFNFYYNAVDTDVPVFGAWESLGKTKDVMGSNVLVGMINATATDSVLGQSVWNNFRMSCPLEAVNAATNCGAVTEDAGMAVVNAVNYLEQYPSNTTPQLQWMHKTRNSLPAMYFNGDNFDDKTYPNAPLLEYGVDIARAGTYYVWLYGYSPNNSGDTIQIGLNGQRLNFGTMEDQSGSGLRWFNTNTAGNPVSMFLEQGVHTLDFWGAEDDFELIQILLTTQSGFTPQSEFYPQSACLAPVPPELPAKLQQCTEVLQNSGFETGDNAGFALNWNTGGLDESADYGATAYEDSFGLAFRSVVFGTIRNKPYTYQRFTVPNWLNANSTADLSLYKAVDRLGQSTAADKLLVVLRDENGQDVTNPVTLATGADLPDVGGGLPLSDDFRPFPQDSAQENNLFAGGILNSPTIEQLAGANLRAFIYMPNSPSDPNYPASTDFFIDNVELSICTEQPEPAAELGKGKVEGQVYIQTLDAGLKAIAGAPVWLFRLDPPGPVQTTYSVENSTTGTPLGYFSFHNLDPGDTYILYSEFVDSSGAPFGISVPISVAGNQSTSQNLILRFGKVGGGASLFE